MQTTRRSVLRASGMAAVLGATGLAGCGGLLDGDQSGTSAGEWLYDPAVLASAPNVFFGSMDYGTLYEMRDQLPAPATSLFEPAPDSPIQPAEIESLAAVGGGEVATDGQAGAVFGSGVLTGPIPREELEGELEAEESVESAGTYEGYSLFRGVDLQAEVGELPGSQDVDRSIVAAVGDSAALGGVSLAQGVEQPASGEAAVQTMIDTATGDVRKLAETSGPARTVQERVGHAMVSVGAGVDSTLVEASDAAGLAGDLQSQLLSGLEGGGAGVDLDGQRATLTGVLVYESEQRATDTRIVNIVDGASGNLEGREGIETVAASQDGSSIVLTLAGDIQALFETGMETGPTFAQPAPR